MLWHKTVLLLLLVANILFAFEEDKQKHLQACMMIAYVSETLMHKNLQESSSKSIFYATGLSMLAGLGKELYDENDYGGFSEKDLIADAIGAFGGAILSHYINRKYIFRIAHDQHKKRTKIEGGIKF